MKIDPQGRLLNDDGSLFLDPSTGQPVKVHGAVPQEIFDQKLGERLAREREAADSARAQLISELEKKIQAGVSPERAKELQSEIDRLTTELQTAGAREKRTREAAEAASRAAEARAELYRQQYRDAQLRSALTAAAAATRFRNPTDLVNNVAAAVQWEEVPDSTGRPVSKFKIVMPFTDPDTGRVYDKEFTPEQAAAEIARRFPHYVDDPGKRGSTADVPVAPGPPTRGGSDAQRGAKLSPHEAMVAALNDPGTVGKSFSD